MSRSDQEVEEPSLSPITMWAKAITGMPACAAAS
jgi:hypothetical protein